MKLQLKPGKYVLAVSGGVDSVVLLDLLSREPGLDLVVAHFNHGIRPDAAQDEKLVKLAAQKYELPVELGYGRLEARASEDTARQARYKFLNQVKKDHGAAAVVTAHHQDDLIETALINILRGTGPQGLIAISSNPDIIRPLLGVSKKEIYNYAKEHSLDWREDSTNQDTDYLRNYVRHNVLSKLTPTQRQQILDNIDQIAKSKSYKDELIAKLAKAVAPGGKINRAKFSVLPSEVANELLVYLLRQQKIRDLDSATVNRINLLIRTTKPGSTHNVKNGVAMVVSKDSALFESVT